MATIKILLADDHQMFLESMSMLLHTIDGLELVATAANGIDVMKLLEAYETDVLICDLQMPLMGGIEVILKVRQKHPAVKVLILTMSDEAAHVREALQAGASGYLLKTANKSELENAIRVLAGGKPYFSNGVIMSLTKPQDVPLAAVPLSDRELEILKLIVSELSSTQIAEKLFISFNTVETHRKNLYKKLGINSSLGLLKYALKHGLID
ncbi:response regulator [Emticicia sp. CRIBPO]|uniref:response regulator transcription factor n=1 Tax=Emticicia sp. CRIBPO TaxID=2683258 RepID=UPI001412E09C|nr:response regulator transcription factor [Emticicia sp. CRIBPO]NBA86121.1 response regulator [Emticicia sp. CRIBPO]